MLALHFLAPFFQVVQRHSFVLIYLKAFHDESLHFRADVKALSELDRNPDHFIHQFLLGPALPGGLAMQQLVHHDAYRPDVVFDSVNVFLKSFWRHVEGTAYIVSFPLEGAPE